MRRWTASFPYLFWMAVFIIVPLLMVIYYALVKDVNGQAVFTLTGIERAFDPKYLKVLFKSILIALNATGVCLLLGYPVAYILASKGYDDKTTLLFLFAVPMWMNMLLRTYGWLTLLETNGVINTFLEFVGIPKFDILYTDQAVLLGMVYNFLPYMILPVHTVLRKIDKTIIESAQDLGASPLRVFTRVVLPLSVPGVISGVTMVFMPAVTTFVISTLLGGGQYILIGNLIERQYLEMYDWNFGSALSLILMIIMLVSMFVMSAIDRGEGGVSPV